MKKKATFKGEKAEEVARPWMRKRRKELKLSQKALAQKVRVGVSSVGNVEKRGRFLDPTKMQRLAAALGVPLEAFGEPPEDKRHKGKKSQTLSSRYWLINRRLQKHIAVHRIAEKAGIKYAEYTAIEAGKSSGTEKARKKIAAILGFPEDFWQNPPDEEKLLNPWGEPTKPHVHPLKRPGFYTVSKEGVVTGDYWRALDEMAQRSYWEGI